MTDRAILNVSTWQLVCIEKALQEMKVQGSTHGPSLQNLIDKVNNAKVFKAGG